MKNYTSPEFNWPHYKHPGSNLLSVFSASGTMSPILKRAQQVFPKHLVRFVQFQELERLHEEQE